MREIVLDTETTGLDPEQGHRIVEIGCVELWNHVPTGKIYQQYLNPEREMEAEVVAVHGLTTEFLSGKPKFSEIADDFLAFIGSDAPLIIHNASFDMKFLNAELAACKKENIPFSRAVDTLLIARRKFPGKRANLDELCKRFHVDASGRSLHGALLDSYLLAEVYLELIGGKEPGLSLKNVIEQAPAAEPKKDFKRTYHAPRVFDIPADELQQHSDFISKIKNSIWNDA